MTELLTVIPCGVEPESYEVRYSANDMYLGDIVLNDDGYYVFFPEMRGGYWEMEVLDELAQELGELNADWDAWVKSETALSSKGE